MRTLETCISRLGARRKGFDVDRTRQEQLRTKHAFACASAPANTVPTPLARPIAHAAAARGSASPRDAARGVEGMDGQPGQDLGVEEGALLRHHLPASATGPNVGFTGVAFMRKSTSPLPGAHVARSPRRVLRVAEVGLGRLRLWGDAEHVLEDAPSGGPPRPSSGGPRGAGRASDDARRRRRSAGPGGRDRPSVATATKLARSCPAAASAASAAFASMSWGSVVTVNHAAAAREEILEARTTASEWTTRCVGNTTRFGSSPFARNVMK